MFLSTLLPAKIDQALEPGGPFISVGRTAVRSVSSYRSILLHAAAPRFSAETGFPPPMLEAEVERSSQASVRAQGAEEELGRVGGELNGARHEVLAPGQRERATMRCLRRCRWSLSMPVCFFFVFGVLRLLLRHLKYVSVVGLGSLLEFTVPPVSQVGSLVVVEFWTRGE